MDNSQNIKLKWLISEVAQLQNVEPQKLSYPTFIKTLRTIFADKSLGYVERGWQPIKTAAERMGGRQFHAHRDRLFLPTANKTTVKEEINKRMAKTSREAQADTVEPLVFMEQFEAVTDKAFKNKIIVKPYATKKDFIAKREINLMLSDLHFHSMLKAGNGTMQYGPAEEARRLAAVFVQACEYKPEHRKETSLNVHLLGDIIAGDIHWPREGDALARQAASAIHLLSQGIAFSATKFGKVKVKAATGNHDRWPNRHGRDAVDKVNSVATVIYYSIKKALAHIPNIEFEIPNSPFYIASGVAGDSFFTHGDTVFNVGNVGTQINVKNLEQQANRIRTSFNPNIKLFGSGHVHTPTIVYLPCGSVVIINGALIPADQYAQSIGIFSTSCGQWIYESTPGYALGDSRLAVVDSSIDKDASLEKIVSPFTGF